MFCQANKPNIGIFQEKKKAILLQSNPFHYWKTRFPVLSPVGMVQLHSKGLLKRDYLFKNKISRSLLSHKAASLKQWNTLTCKQNQRFSALSCYWLHIVIKCKSLNKLQKVSIHRFIIEVCSQKKKKKKEMGSKKSSIGFVWDFPLLTNMLKSTNSGRHCQSFQRTAISSVTRKGTALKMCSQTKIIF